MKKAYCFRIAFIVVVLIVALTNLQAQIADVKSTVPSTARDASGFALALSNQKGHALTVLDATNQPTLAADNHLSLSNGTATFQYYAALTKWLLTASMTAQNSAYTETSGVDAPAVLPNLLLQTSNDAQPTSETDVTPSASATVQLIDDNQGVTVGNASFLVLASNNATANNRTFTLSNGVQNGQVLVILLTANAAELADSGNCNLDSHCILGSGDTIKLIWYGSMWYEINRSNN